MELLAEISRKFELLALILLGLGAIPSALAGLEWGLVGAISFTALLIFIAALFSPLMATSSYNVIGCYVAVAFCGALIRWVRDQWWR